MPFGMDEWGRITIVHLKIKQNSDLQSLKPVVRNSQSMLADIASDYRLTLNSLAVDMPLYLHDSSRNDAAFAVVRLEQCMMYITADRLTLNVDKTDLLWAGTRHPVNS